MPGEVVSAQPASMPNDLAFADNSRLARNKTPPPRITKRIREAIDVMVERGLDFQAAAHEAKLTTRHMRMQLAKPHVIAYYREQCQVFRASTTARNIHRLCEIRDAADNMPAVNAIKTLEQLDAEAVARPAGQISPGIVIRFVTQASPAPIVDITPRVAVSSHGLPNSDE